MDKTVIVDNENWKVVSHGSTGFQIVNKVTNYSVWLRNEDAEQFEVDFEYWKGRSGDYPDWIDQVLSLYNA